MQSAPSEQIVTENAHKSSTFVMFRVQNLAIEPAGVHAPP